MFISELQELKIKVLNNKYPFYSDEELNQFLEMYDTVDEAAYAICKNKASMTDVEFGGNSVTSMSKFWLSKANEFRKPKHGRIKRVDEL